MPICYEPILQLETLPLHHGAPFDCLLIAQAKAENLPIFTADKMFKLYDVKVIFGRE